MDYDAQKQATLDRILSEGRAAGTHCVDCPREIEKSRIEWSKNNGYNAPKYCYTCSKKRKQQYADRRDMKS